MPTADMAQDDGLSSAGQPHAAPDINSKAMPNLPFPVALKTEFPGPVSSQESPSTRELPRITKFSKTHVVAKRGHNRLRVPWSSQRAPLKSQPTPNSNEGSKSSRLHEPRVDPISTSTQDPRNEEVQINSEPAAQLDVPKNRTERPFGDANLNKVKGLKLLMASEIENRRSSEDIQEVSFSHLSQAVADSSEETPFQPPWSPDLGVEKPEGVGSSRTTPCSLQCPSDKNQEPSKSNKDTVAETRTNPPANTSSSVPSPSLNHVELSDPIRGHEIHEAIGSSPQLISFQGSSESGGAADIESNIENEDFRPYARSRRKGFDAFEESSEPELEDSLVAPPAARSDDESVSMSLESPNTAATFQDSPTVQVAGEGNCPHDDNPPAVPLHIMLATERKANFDSDAFDAMIYHQSKSQPPNGAAISTRSRKQASLPDQHDRLFLHINPAIHRPHRRPELWFRKKSNEINKRGRRKEWYGKYHERQRFMEAQEAERETERQQALEASDIPPRQDPQPRPRTRVMFLADHDDEDLPEYVQENAAWMKAVAWFRETEKQKRQQEEKKQREEHIPQRNEWKTPREQHVQMTTEETERFYRNIFQPPNSGHQ